MASFIVSKLAVAIWFLSHVVTAITQCPTTPTTYTGTGGAKYAVCAATDYQGPSDQVLANIATVTACAQACDQNGNCLKAVYDNTNKVCHIKNNAANALTWVQNNQFSVVYLNNDLPEATNIARCPFTETTYTNSGKTYKICPDTDVRGASAQMINNVANTQDCATRCATTNGCVRAVFDTVALVCHIKADAAANTLIWSTNKRFDVIRQDVAATPATLGSWSDLARFPVIPVAAYIVPAFPESSRLLMFSSWGKDAFGGAGGQTQFADYNFKTGAISARTVANTGHDMFCPGISSLQDGRILITGGSNADVTSFYDPASNAFTKGPNMITPRGYQTSTTLSDGRIFTIGGAYSPPIVAKDAEVYDPVGNKWTALPNAKVGPMLTVDHEGVWREDNHGWLVGWKNGSVFQAGPSQNQNWYGTAGTGSQAAAGIRDTAAAMCGVWAMYEPGKIFSAGGAPDYTDSPATNRAHITTINNPNQAAAVERVADMAYPRGFANAVVLPDGQVLVTGGQKRSLVFTDTDGILAAEIFNPATKTWKTLAAEAVPRNYHSVSLLLPDGTVFSGGGGLCYVGQPGASSANCDKAVDHADGQIFTPPYLFKADGTAATRPVISTVSATTVKVGAKLTASVNMANSKLVLVRIGSSTHSINSDQRRVPLTNVAVSGTSYTATLPADSGILIPGHYYLFAVSSTGVPSVAKTVRVTL
ncbi:hypothetical protein Daus18300_008831 [Diaporthe australafricana]|uniref:Apple domain-containing protein n=1 Tax=Diaporthe australafricana TaxID=127596 RepID=A0ABR3WGZ3_9PEZI